MRGLIESLSPTHVTVGGVTVAYAPCFETFLGWCHEDAVEVHLVVAHGELAAAVRKNVSPVARNSADAG